jgi:hypothetical protein
LERLADLALEGARPRPGNAFNLPRARAAIARAFQTLAERYASVLRLDAAEGVIDGRGHLCTNHHNPMEPARV